jgi:hypothetical protein
MAEPKRYHRKTLKMYTKPTSATEHVLPVAGRRRHPKGTIKSVVHVIFVAYLYRSRWLCTTEANIVVLFSLVMLECVGTLSFLLPLSGGSVELQQT